VVRRAILDISICWWVASKLICPEQVDALGFGIVPFNAALDYTRLF